MEIPSWARWGAAVVVGTVATINYLNEWHASKQDLAMQEELNQKRALRAELRTTRSDRNNVEARMKENAEALYFWKNDAAHPDENRIIFLESKIKEQQAEVNELTSAVEELEKELTSERWGE